MHIAKLLGDLGIGVDVEIIEAFLPEPLWNLDTAPKFPLVATLLASALQQAAGDPLLENLHDDRRIVSFRFTNVEVDMLRHHYKSHDVKARALPNLLENIEEDVARSSCSQKGLTSVAAGCDEMKVASTVKAAQRIAFRS